MCVAGRQLIRLVPSSLDDDLLGADQGSADPSTSRPC